MNKEPLYRVVLVTLLAATLVVQMLILWRIPPRTEAPFVRVKGTVDVEVQNTSLGVEIENTFPLEVEVQNTPLDVQIQR